MIEDDMYMINYVLNIKFPRFFDVINIIKDDVESRYYYNAYFHKLLTELWRNIDNDEIIYNIGLKICVRGGKTALNVCLYIFINILRKLIADRDIDGVVIFHKIKNHLINLWCVELV